MAAIEALLLLLLLHTINHWVYLLRWSWPRGWRSYCVYNGRYYFHYTTLSVCKQLNNIQHDTKRHNICKKLFWWAPTGYNKRSDDGISRQVVVSYRIVSSNLLNNNGKNKCVAKFNFVPVNCCICITTGWRYGGGSCIIAIPTLSPPNAPISKHSKHVYCLWMCFLRYLCFIDYLSGCVNLFNPNCFRMGVRLGHVYFTMLLGPWVPGLRKEKKFNR